MPRSLLLGMDVGGTHTRAWLVDGEGRILSRARAPGANYQSVGVEKARRHMAQAVEQAFDQLATPLERFDAFAAGYGVAGADRPKDFELVRTLLPHLPSIPSGPAREALVNDSELVLHAGAFHGVGVGLVAGTGTNAVGRDAQGKVRHVGGMGWELGDFGSAGDIGREAIRQAMRGRDGRGKKTALYEAICEFWKLNDLLDLVDLWLTRDPGWDRAGELAPLVFEVARHGDEVATSILRQAGEQLGLSAKVLLDGLFGSNGRDGPVPVVLGGSVLQRPGLDPLKLALFKQLKESPVPVEVRVLQTEPVVGAVLLAAQRLDDPAVEKQVRRGLVQSLGVELARTVERFS